VPVIRKNLVTRCCIPRHAFDARRFWDRATRCAGNVPSQSVPAGCFPSVADQVIVRVLRWPQREPPSSQDDIAYGAGVGMRVITMDEYEAIGREKVIEEIERTTGDGPIYISFDTDGLDASQAMGTGVPEIGGLSRRDAQVMLRSLQGKRVVGADICEVAPMYDPTGLTQLNAANLMFEVLCIIAGSRQVPP
jgi:arginase family enzyme